MAELTEIPISPPPGVVKTDSNRVIEGRWSDTLNMRFVQKLPQKIGGWIKGFVTSTWGTPRTLHAWRDNKFNQFVAVGTYVKLYVYDTSLAQNDITPYRATGTLGNNPFTTALGSPNVTVSHTSHGLSPNDVIYYSGATAVGGITPNGQFQVQTIIDNNTYTFAFTSNATSATTGGGAAVAFQYEVPIGVEIGTYGYGYGVGGYGLGTFGTARTVSTLFIEPRVWSQDHFGQLLVSTYNGGSIYSFDPTAVQPWGRATVVDASAPTNCRAMFVTPERFIMALLDNMQVAWPSQGSLTDWTPSSTNTANVRTLTEGTKLITGRVLADFVSLIWTDAAVYLFQYSGSAFIYNSSMIAKDCGLIGPNGAVTVGGIAYWIGQDNLWTYNGSVGPMPNVEDIRKWVYDQLDINFGYTCVAIYNPKFHEVWFFFTIKGQTNPTIGLIYAINGQCWAPLYWGRCGGTHFTQGDTTPYMGDAVTDLIYRHENGLDADGAILPYSATLSPYALSKGGKFNYGIEYIVPDFFGQIGNVTLTMTTWDRLNDSTTLDSETETIAAQDSGTIDTRISGRYIGLVFSASSLGCYVRMGLPVAFVLPMGDRS
jgi:hypothetical protein